MRDINCSGVKIDKNDFVGEIENRIGNGFTDRRACDLANRIAAAAHVLNVEGWYKTAGKSANPTKPVAMTNQGGRA
jgi:hypothetical protein